MKSLCLLDCHGDGAGASAITAVVTLGGDGEAVRTGLLGGGVAIDTEAKALGGLGLAKWHAYILLLYVIYA